MSEGRQPDYNVSIRGEDKWHTIGVAWYNEDSKTISLQLNPFVILPHGSCTKLTFFPRDYVPKSKQEKAKPIVKGHFKSPADLAKELEKGPFDA